MFCEVSGWEIDALRTLLDDVNLRVDKIRQYVGDPEPSMVPDWLMWPGPQRSLSQRLDRLEEDMRLLLKALGMQRCDTQAETRICKVPARRAR